MFNKILIANRGEIACRVIETCRRLGINTVVVYSEADINSRHVRMADEAVCIGPAPASESYLNVDAVLAAAKQTGAEAIHPGYGFLSENDKFAERCSKEGIQFIGPPAEAIRAMGSKSEAKKLMEAAGVPLVPGYHGDDQSDKVLRKSADEIGYPVLLKASAGGGGKGMRVVESGDDFDAALASCRRESKASFDDDHMLVEKYLQKPRHIEIQVFGDKKGNVVSLFERDCSAQRRHQKVVEEAPAPGMSAEQREAMGNAACDAARAVGYYGAGTVEFIVDADGTFYFMEMNTRLQVEHPVTEKITGQDLVEWQLLVASGDELPLRQEEISIHGHAVEVRIYAEQPEKGFLPAIGDIRYMRPPNLPNVRLDLGVEEGDQVTPFYDPMIGKMIVWGENRSLAFTRMIKALGDFHMVGVGNNIAFLARLLAHEQFRNGPIDTRFIERELDELVDATRADPPFEATAAAVLWQTLQEGEQAKSATSCQIEPGSPWADSDGWRINGTANRLLEFEHGESQIAVNLVYTPGGLLVDDKTVKILNRHKETLTYSVDGSRFSAQLVSATDSLHVFFKGEHFKLNQVDRLALADKAQEVTGGVISPMPGKILSLLVEPGTEVEAGTPLLVMEAMKMEHTLRAPAKGNVQAFHYKVGDSVQDGVELVAFEPETES